MRNLLTPGRVQHCAEVTKHELYNREWIDRVFELLQFNSFKDRTDHFSESDPCCFVGREFSHCNNRMQNANLKKVDKLFHRKHGRV